MLSKFSYFASNELRKRNFSYGLWSSMFPNDPRNISAEASTCVALPLSDVIFVSPTRKSHIHTIGTDGIEGLEGTKY